VGINCAIDALEEPDREAAAALYLIAVAEAGARYASYRIESLTLNGAPLLALLTGEGPQPVDLADVAVSGVVTQASYYQKLATQQQVSA
jgi:hypothetical protein